MCAPAHDVVGSCLLWPLLLDLGADYIDVAGNSTDVMSKYLQMEAVSHMAKPAVALRIIHVAPS